LLDGKNRNEIYVLDGNGNGMGAATKSLKWEGFGTKNLFPHISNPYCDCELQVQRIDVLNVQK